MAHRKLMDKAARQGRDVGPNEIMIKEAKYLTGERILTGDLVKVGTWDGAVVAVVTRDSPEWVDYIGEGVTIEGPAFGRIHTSVYNEDLILVRRKEG